MKKNTIKPETKLKLQELANNLYSKHGIDVINFSNFRSLTNIENDKLEEPMSYRTVVKYQSYLVKVIQNLEEANKEIIRRSLYKAVIEEKTISEEKIKEIDYYICVYKDGSIERKDRKKVEPKTEELYIGLFNYADNKITIRRGFYEGINIKSIASILSKFSSLEKFEIWCNNRIKDVEDKKIIPNVDTPRDMETLRQVLNKLELRKSDKL